MPRAHPHLDYRALEGRMGIHSAHYSAKLLELEPGGVWPFASVMLVRLFSSIVGVTFWAASFK